MKKTQRAGVLLLCLWMALLTACTPAERPVSGTAGAKEQTQMSKETTTQAPADLSGAQDVIDRVREKYGAVGLQVAVIRGGKAAESFVSGDSVYGETPMDAAKKYRIASVSKVVLGMLAMRMQEEKILNVDTPIATYWGATIDKPLTLSALLTHTSTLGDLDYRSTRAQTLAQLKSAGSYSGGTIGDPASWRYNNYAMGVAGSTLEVAADVLLDDYAARTLFTPLGIEAAFNPGRLPEETLGDLYYHGGSVARSAKEQAQTKLRTTPGDSTGFFAGGLTVTAQDLAKLIAVLANDGSYDGKQLLSPASVARIEKQNFETQEHGGTFMQCMPLRYRAGLYGTDGLYYHTGNAYGLLALVSYDKTTKNGVVVISTGATQHRDTQGIYSVCGEISAAIYAGLRGETMTVPEEKGSLEA